ncbi:hypothetical protein [Alcaligenes faecalis]|uniref:hypothetical protein n=1 Tax=Alcaligenes faecalis TaxID=511 RepID=UPI0024BC3FD4|nr:hypothetical protein [Alcaligenes faecalis]WHQ45827.1 hypothetical protein E8D21_19385 [Alcaligenes faecalis]
MDYRLSTQEARSHLAAYHHWLLKSRPAEAYGAASKYQQIVERLNGGTNQGSYTHAQSAGSQIRDKLSAPEGRMPMGQRAASSCSTKASQLSSQAPMFLIKLAYFKSHFKRSNLMRCSSATLGIAQSL